MEMLTRWGNHRLVATPWLCQVHVQGRQHRSNQMLCQRTGRQSPLRCSHRAITCQAAVNGRPGQSAAHVYCFNTHQGHLVHTQVNKQGSTFVVTIDVDGSLAPGSEELHVSWGAYRASAGKWFHPEKLTPTGTQPDPHNSRAKLSKLQQAGGNGKGSLHRLEFKVPSQIAPVMLGFQVKVDGESEPTYIGPRHGSHFTVPVGVGKGTASKLGPALDAVSQDGSCSITFAVRSRHAARMSLCLARTSTPAGSKGGYLEVTLDPIVNKSGDTWHICLEGLKEVGTLCYGWRAEADAAWGGGSRFHPGQIMLDPCCPIVSQVTVPDNVNLVPPRGGAAGSMPRNTPEVLLGSLAFLLDDVLAGNPNIRLQHSMEDTVILELDVPTFAQGSDVGPSENQGKYLGVLDHVNTIKAAGATAVLLTPVVASAEGQGPMGRAPVSFFAPEPSMASGDSPNAAAQELKQMIRGLHEEGIEVLLQAEYCFTAEGTDKNPTAYSLRGLDAAVYYRSNGVLNCGHAVVRTLIIDSLKHWALEYQVDGFCFVNAETLVQDRDGTILDNPPLAEEIAQEPLLQGLKMVAWAADDSLLPRGGTRGFPHWGIWTERNKAFQKDIVGWLVQAQPAMASKVATRITGSADLLAADWEGGLPGTLAAGRRPSFGLNFVAAVGQDSMAQVVGGLMSSYEGEPATGTLAKTLLLSVLVSHGTPVLTQEVITDSELLRFVGALSRLRRKQAALLLPADFDELRSITWHGASAGSAPDWSGEAATNGYPGANFVGLSITPAKPKPKAKPPARPAAGSAGSATPAGIRSGAPASPPHAASISSEAPAEQPPLQKAPQGALYIGFNAHSTLLGIHIPDPPTGFAWKRAVDTAQKAPSDAAVNEAEYSDFSGNYYELHGKAGLVLVAVKLPQTRAGLTAGSSQGLRTATAA